MSLNRMNRRNFLRGIGGFTLALPLMESFVSESAYAAQVAGPRYVAIHSFNGQRKMYWDPTLPGNSAFTSYGAGLQTAPLSIFNGSQINQILDANFNPYFPRMNFIQGLDVIPMVGHNQGAMVGNYNDATTTIDQVMAQSVKVYPVEPSIRSLLLGGSPNAPQSFSYAYSGSVLLNLPSYTNAQAAFDRVFYSADASKISRHLAVVDAVYADYKNLKTNTRLSSSDKQVLDRHLTTIQELQMRLKTQAPLMCPTPAARPTVGDLTSISLTDIEFYYQTLNTLISVAFACGATRIATLNIAHPNIYNGNDWHGPSHDYEDTPIPTHLTINNWIANKIVLDLAKKLDIPETAGKTYLDNSVIHWGNELSLGRVHSNDNLPTVLLGGMSGQLKTGQWINYFNQNGYLIPDGEYPSGRPINQLFVTLLQSMGLSPSDYETAGTPGYANSIFTDATRASHYTTLMSQLGSPLPLLKA